LGATVACGQPSAPAPTPAPLASAKPSASAPASSSASAPIASASSARAAGPPPFCDAKRTNMPCVFMLQGRCFVQLAPNTNWQPTTCRPEPPLPASACARTEQCPGISDEGCCVDCANNVMATALSKACAPKIEAAPDCAGVTAVLQTKGCIVH
jgi:hypothetical protein